MAKKSKKALGAAMAGVMAVGAVAGAANTVVTQVKADVASDVKAAHAKLEHLRTSLHNNYLGLKNQATWEIYAKEAQALINKLPNGSTKTTYQERLDRANAMILAAASVNHAEFSIQKNFPKADNANQWKAYAEKAMANVEKVEKGQEYSDRTPILVNRVVKVNAFADVVLKLEDAREAKDVAAMEALKEEAADLMTYFRDEMNYKDLMAYDLVEVIDQRIEEAGGLVEEDTEAPVLKVDGATEITVENGAEVKLPVVTATDNIDEAVEVTSVIKDAAGNEIEKIDTTVAGVYTVTYSAEDAAGNKAEDVVVTVTVKEAKLAVKSVNAINNSKVKISFNKAVDSLDRSAVVISDKKTSDRLYVKSVNLAADKMSAEVELYDTLVSKSTYITSVKVGEVTATSEFDYVEGEVAKIEAKATQLIPASTNTAIEYKVLDANGLDITSTTNVTFESTATITNGEINLSSGESAFVYVVYEKADGTKVKSERITVKAEASKAVKLLSYTLSSNPVSKTDFESADFSAVTSAKMGTTPSAYVFVEDQFGNKSVASGVEFESLNKAVALVDRNTGKITPIKAGLADIRIKVGDVSVVRSIEIKEEAKDSSLSLDKTSVSLSDKVPTGQSVKVTVKDQFGDAVKTSGKTITASVKAGLDIVTIDASADTDANGVATFTVKPVAGKEGTATIELSLGDIKTTLTVNVVKAGEVENYVVEGFKGELDVNGDITDSKKLPEKMTLKVFGTDANGVKTGDALSSNVTYTVKEGSTTKTGNGISTTSGVLTLDASAAGSVLEAGKTYTVVAKVGSLEVLNKTFTVKDTASKPVVTQKSSSVKSTANIGADIFADLGNAFEVSYDGVVKSTAEVVSITFNSDNESVIASSTDATAVNTLSAGSATLVVSKVKIDLDGNTGDTSDQYEITLNSLVNVTVKDETKPVLKADSPIAIDSEKKVVTISLSEGVSAVDATALKSAVKVATNGTDFVALGENDSVAISEGKLVVTFENALTGANNKIEVAAGALKDLAGNVNDKITTAAISAE